VFWTAASVRIVRYPGGSLQGTEGLVRDIGERVQAEEALRASERHFRAFFERAGIGMATTSPEKGWIEVNDALCRMLGHSREELCSMTWAELTHPDDLAPDVAQFERLTAGELDGYAMDERFICRDGRVAHAHLVVQRSATTVHRASTTWPPSSSTSRRGCTPRGVCTASTRIGNNGRRHGRHSCRRSSASGGVRLLDLA